MTLLQPPNTGQVRCERLVVAANNESMATCVLRPSVIFGEDDYALIPSVYACIAKGESAFVLGSGDNLWDVVYVGNAADAHILAVENLLGDRTAGGQVINVSNNQPVTFRDICLAIWACFGHVPRYHVHIPVSIAWLAGGVAEVCSWLSGHPATFTRGSVKDAIRTRYANTTKSSMVLGYVPRVDLAEGIRRSCEVWHDSTVCMKRLMLYRRIRSDLLRSNSCSSATMQMDPPINLREHVRPKGGDETARVRAIEAANITLIISGSSRRKPWLAIKRCSPVERSSAAR